MASSRAIVNWFLDLALAFSLLFALWTAALLKFVFPSGLAGAGWTLLGWNKEAWSNLHFASLFFFTVLALVHVMLHWSWVCGIVAQQLSRKLGRKVNFDDSMETLIGVAILVAALHVLGGMMLAAMMLIREPAGQTPTEPAARRRDASLERIADAAARPASDSEPLSGTSIALLNV
mgnify:CR=1 FL=1